MREPQFKIIIENTPRDLKTPNKYYKEADFKYWPQILTKLPYSVSKSFGLKQ